MTRDSFVYFASPPDGGPIKIGCSQIPQNRLVSLMALVPYPLVLLATAPGNLNDERKLHTAFLADHLRSEWFRPSVEMWALIGRIRETGILPVEMRGSDKEPDKLRSKINAKSIRATPEWRAKMSEVHKATWARIKERRVFEASLRRFMASNSLTPAIVNASPPFAGLGRKPLGTRSDGTFWIDTDHQKTLEEFMASYERKAA